MGLSVNEIGMNERVTDCQVGLCKKKSLYAKEISVGKGENKVHYKNVQQKSFRAIQFNLFLSFFPFGFCQSC